MTTLFSLFLSFGLIVTPAPKAAAKIEHIHNYTAETHVYIDRNYRIDDYIFYIPLIDNKYESAFNGTVTEGQNIDIKIVYGTFSGGNEALNYKMINTYLHNFKAFDGSLIWQLEADEIGFTPIDGKNYMLVYYENGTTAENHTCPVKLGCDCFTYDDVFLGVYEI